MKSRTHTVFKKQFMAMCIGVFMKMKLSNLLQIGCTEYIEDQGSSQPIWQKPNKYKCDTINEDWSWSARQQLKYKYSKQDSLDIASRVISGRLHKTNGHGIN